MTRTSTLRATRVRMRLRTKGLAPSKNHSRYQPQMWMTFSCQVERQGREKNIRILSHLDMATYDDRALPRFAAVRNTTRGQLILGGIAIGFVLIIAGLGLSQRNLSIQRPSDLGLVFLV